MKIDEFRVIGIRCFEDTGDVPLSPTCNLIVGTNNAGKSTVLRSILLFQGHHFADDDLRTYAQLCFTSILTSNIQSDIHTHGHLQNLRPETLQILHSYRGTLSKAPKKAGITTFDLSQRNAFFGNTRPGHAFVPLLARRKAVNFSHNITAATQRELSGTFSNLYSRIDELATYGHPRHQVFVRAVESIVGFAISTRASKDGKEAGRYQGDNFISLERMGDGVSEMLGLIVELCTAEGRVFVLEEPETNLHPSGLKALLSLVREAAQANQFIIATHSNIVVRELASDAATKIFHVKKDDEDDASTIDEIPQTPAARLGLLRELGYDFADFDLHEAWLFLEESSAEQIINEILIPQFTPQLRGRLRTFSARGISNVEPGVEEFQRLITYLHLQPIYAGRMWVRVDGDRKGLEVVSSLRTKFQYLTDDHCAVFTQAAFERYYPAQFQNAVNTTLTISNREEKRRAKAELLREVLEWTRQGSAAAVHAWSESASEVISALNSIADALEQQS